MVPFLPSCGGVHFYLADNPFLEVGGRVGSCSWWDLRAHEVARLFTARLFRR